MNSKKYISKNGYSKQTNIIVGSLTYFFLHVIVLAVSYKIWGFEMFDEPYFYIMHLVAFISVKLILRDLIRFWVY